MGSDAQTETGLVLWVGAVGMKVSAADRVALQPGQPVVGSIQLLLKFHIVGENDVQGKVVVLMLILGEPVDVGEPLDCYGSVPVEDWWETVQSEVFEELTGSSMSVGCDCSGAIAESVGIDSWWTSGLGDEEADNDVVH